MPDTKPFPSKLSIASRANFRHCTTSLKSLVHNMKQIVIEVSSQTHARKIFYGLFVVILVIWAFASFVRRQRSISFTRPSTPSNPNLEKAHSSALRKNPDRKPGEWIPSNFKTPTPPSYPDWSVERTKPLPYRPFRYGPKYFVTMGLRPMPWDSWIELDNYYPHFHATKARRIQERGDKCCRTAPEAYPAAVELLEELCAYLPARYPSLYRKTDAGMENIWSGELFDITADRLSEDPMQMAVSPSNILISICCPYYSFTNP